MALSKIKTNSIADNAITSTKIGVDVIVAEDLASNSITVAEIASNAVTTAKIADANVTTDKLATTLTVTHALGSASTPSITFTGDTNTGIFSPAADTIAFSEGGTESMRITSAGRVAIGTAETGAELNVYGLNANPVSSTTFWTPNHEGIVLRNTSDVTSTVTGISFQGGSSGAGISGIGNILENTTLGALGFFTGGSGRGNTVPERMRIDSSGNVGIGTDSPSAKLHVAKTSGSGYAAYLSSGVNVSGSDNGLFIGGFDENSGSKLLNIQTNVVTPDASSFRSRFVVRNDGVVLVGIDTATAFTSGTTPRILAIAGGSTGTGSTGILTGLALANSNNSAGTGYGVQIKLHMSAGEVGKYASIAGVADSGYANSTALAFFTNPNGVNGADNVTQRMYISGGGSIGAPSGTNIYNASDERLKKNISDLTSGLDTINALRPVSFNWQENFCKEENDKLLYGFIAQETQEVDEHLVEGFGVGHAYYGDSENPTVVEDPLRVNEKFIIPILVKAVQELKAEFDEYKRTHP
jgi:hypothetical protein